MRPPYRAPTRDFYFSAGVPALPRFSCLVCCAGVEPPPPSFLHPISLPPSFDSDELLFTNHDTHPPAFRLSVLSFVRVFCVLFLLYGVYRPGGRRFSGGGDPYPWHGAANLPLHLQICKADKCVYRNPQTLVSHRKHYHATCSHIHQVNEFHERRTRMSLPPRLSPLWNAGAREKGLFFGTEREGEGRETGVRESGYTVVMLM